MPHFSSRLIHWQKQHGRHDLPWQNTRDPYAIWLSEIMLQQTQVGTVMPYFARFMQRFPDIASLATASEDEVLQHWSGLGYYSRARNLHRAAQIMLAQHAGAFPSDFEQIMALPGIGRSTAAAISVFAFGQRRAILDGNVKRVFARYFGIDGYPGENKTENALWLQAEHLLPESGIEIYTQALMDLGATVCNRTKPVCTACPLQSGCVAHGSNRIAQLPAPKPRKPLPQRETVMLLLMHQGEILLEKRPSTGIWGGMWSFPEMPMEDDAAQFCAERFGLMVTHRQALPQFEHVFTHFKLRITPQPLQVDAILPHANECGRMWLNLDEALGAAIPAPTKKILQRMRDRS